MKLPDAVEIASHRILRRDAETLLLHVAGRDRAWLLAHPEAELTPKQMEHLTGLVTRRAAHEPLQYLTGHQEFRGLDLLVTPDVLIPRPETELLVEAVLEWLRERATGEEQGTCLVDVGTGSGAIALALASEAMRAQVWALDLSRAALAIARMNALRLQLESKVRFSESDLLQAFLMGASRSRQADVVVSNPPYVPTGDAETMQPEVRDYEPHFALFAGTDGLEVYRRLIPQASQALRQNGLLAMEFGFGQKADLVQLLTGWRNVRVLDDYAGIPRIVLANRP